MRTTILGIGVFVAAMSCLETAVLGQAAGTSAEDTEKAKKLFENGIEFLEEGKIEPALMEFEEAYRILPNLMVLYNIGMCLKELSRYAEASSAFSKFLSEGGESLDKGLRDEAAKLLSECDTYTGILSIHCATGGAEILVDGLSTGFCPLDSKVKLDLGKHTVLAIGEGYKNFTKTVALRSGETIDLVVDMEKLHTSGKLTITSNLAGASISVDGKPKGTSSWSGAVSEGQHEIEIAAEGYRSFKCSMTLEADEEKLLDAHLLPEPVPSRLEVRTDVSNPEIVLDGAPIETVSFGIGLGNHEISISKKGYEPIERSVYLGESRSLLLDVSLEPKGVSPGWFWSTLSITGLSLVGATVAFFLQRDAYRDLNARYHEPDTRLELKSRGVTAQRTMVGLFITSGIFAAATLVLGFLTDFKSGKETVSIEEKEVVVGETEDCLELNVMNMKIGGGK